MPASPGDIFYTDMPYPDGQTWTSKDRPMLVLATYGRPDMPVCLLCMVTSSPARTGKLRTGDVPIVNLVGTGLIKPSVIRTHRILTLDSSALGSRIGAVDSFTLQQARTMAKTYLLGSL